MIVLLIITATLMIATPIYQKRILQKGTEAEAMRLTKLITQNHHEVLESAKQLLSALANLEEIKNRNPTACNKVLTNLVNAYPRYVAISVADLSGDVFCASIKSATPVNVTDRSYFQRVIKTQEFSIGDYNIGKISKKPILGTAYPVNVNGVLASVIAATIDLSWLADEFANLGLPEEATLLMTDSANVILTSVPTSSGEIGKNFTNTDLIQASLTQKEGVVETSLENKKYLFSFTPLNDTPHGRLYVYVGIPEKTGFSDTIQYFSRDLRWLRFSYTFSLILLFLAVFIPVYLKLKNVQK